MQTIEYRVHYSGATSGTKDRRPQNYGRKPEIETVRVMARDINSGFPKALKRGLEPLGNGVRREISRIEFWAIV